MVLLVYYSVLLLADSSSFFFLQNDIALFNSDFSPLQIFIASWAFLERSGDSKVTSSSYNKSNKLHVITKYKLEQIADLHLFCAKMFL